jgi:hypothetical protein
VLRTSALEAGARCGDAATIERLSQRLGPPVKPSTESQQRSVEARSGLVGAFGQSLSGCLEIALVDEYLRASRQIEWVRAAGVVGRDPCVDPCGCKQALNGLCLEPRRKRADRDLPGDSRTIRRNRPADCIAAPNPL